MLHVVRKAVTLEAQVTDASLNDAIELVKAYGLDEDKFVNAVQKIQTDN